MIRLERPSPELVKCHYMYDDNMYLSYEDDLHILSAC
jgi:hypothetical protein